MRATAGDLFYAWLFVTWFCMMGVISNIDKYAADMVRAAEWLKARREQ